MKTFAIFPTKVITFCVDGAAKEFTPETQIGVVSVDGVSLMDLLGAIQFHHCKAVEIDEAQLMELDSDEDDVVLVIEVDGGGDIGDASASLDDQGGELEGIEEATELTPDAIPAVAPVPKKTNVNQFIVDGLDEKVATSLVDQGLAPEDIRQLITEGFDLTELEDIGKSRAAVLRAIYGQPQ